MLGREILSKLREKTESLGVWSKLPLGKGTRTREGLASQGEKEAGLMRGKTQNR